MDATEGDFEFSEADDVRNEKLVGFVVDARIGFAIEPTLVGPELLAWFNTGGRWTVALPVQRQMLDLCGFLDRLIGRR